MLRDPAAVPALLKAAMRSPNGTADAALRLLEAEDALAGLFRRAIAAAHERAVLMGRNT